MGGFFELVDEGLGLVDGELAVALTLGEPHGTACVAEVAVALVLEELEEGLHLSVRRRWA